MSKSQQDTGVAGGAVETAETIQPIGRGALRPWSRRYVFLSDLHVPYHDEDALELVCRFLKWFRPHTVYLIGDIADFYQVSSYDKDPKRLLKLQDDLDQCYAILQRIQQSAGPKAKFILREGNHEFRMTRYLWTHPQIASLRGLQLPELLNLAELKIEHVPYNGRLLIDDSFLVEHGDVVRKDSAATAKAMLDRRGVSGISGHCFDEATEILTPTGWRRHDVLGEGSIVMTLNRATDALEWNRVQEVFRYDHFKELVTVNASGLDLAVTGGHGLWVGKRRRSRRTVDGRTVSHAEPPLWYESTADGSFGDRVAFRLAGVQDQDGLPLSDAQVRLLAWVISEGHLAFGAAGGVSLRLSQSDSPKDTLADLEDCLRDCGLAYSKTLRYVGGTEEHGTWRNYDAYRFNVHDAASLWRSWLSTYIDGVKTPTQALRGMSLRQRQLFLDTYIAADGSKNSAACNSYQVASNRQEMLDFLQELAVTTGIRSSLVAPSSLRGGVGHITLNTRSTVQTHADSWDRVPYNGVVWCVSVPNGTLVVRRNGKTAITLNTHRLGAYYRSDETGEKCWFENGCLCRLDPDYVMGRPNWQQGFSVMHHWENRYEVSQVRILRRRIFFQGHLWQL